MLPLQQRKKKESEREKNQMGERWTHRSINNDEAKYQRMSQGRLENN